MSKPYVNECVYFKILHFVLEYSGKITLSSDVVVERFKTFDRRLDPAKTTGDFVCSEISSNMISIVEIRSEPEIVGKFTESGSYFNVICLVII